MKTIKLILFCIVCVCGFSNHINAQNTETNTDRFFEQSVNGQIYVYDTLIHRVYNKKNYIEKIREPYDCKWHLGKWVPYDNIFDAIFSAKRKEELKGSILPMSFYCDASGNLLEISFILKDFSKITVKELNAIEQALLKQYKVEIINPCPEKKYYFVGASYRGWRQ